MAGKETIAEINALMKKLEEAGLTDEQRGLLDRIDSLIGQEILEEISSVQVRLRSVLPRYFWPLLSLAFAVDARAWKVFERETARKFGEYGSFD